MRKRRALTRPGRTSCVLFIPPELLVISSESDSRDSVDWALIILDLLELVIIFSLGEGSSWKLFSVAGG
jgi:hypothetical protein